MATQRQRLARRLAGKRQAIDPVIAQREFGIGRLAARIYELELDGWRFNRSWRWYRGRDGETFRVREYVVAKVGAVS